MTNTYIAPTTLEEAFTECQKAIQKCVTKFTRNHYHLRQDFEQEAAIGVIEAWNRYDRSKNNRFSTFAYFWIWEYCKKYGIRIWNQYNTDAPYDPNFNEDHYDLDVDHSIDVERKLGKFDALSLEVYHLRMEGYTFDQISNNLNISNLQKARKIFKSVETKLQA